MSKIAITPVGGGGSGGLAFEKILERDFTISGQSGKIDIDLSGGTLTNADLQDYGFLLVRLKGTFTVAAGSGSSNKWWIAYGRSLSPSLAPGATASFSGCDESGSSAITDKTINILKWLAVAGDGWRYMGGEYDEISQTLIPLQLGCYTTGSSPLTGTFHVQICGVKI